MSELPKTFTPSEIEARWYAHWESTGAFRPARPDADSVPRATRETLARAWLEN